jgi:hypothetical protein
MSQLDLFTHVRPMARVFRFPSERRVTFAHFVAQRLNVLEFEAGRQLWKEVSSDLRKGLKSEGASAADIKASIDRLADEVHDVLHRLSILKQYRVPAVILPLKAPSGSAYQHGDGDGKAGALGQGSKTLVGLGEAHAEYDAARAHDGGAA